MIATSFSTPILKRLWVHFPILDLAPRIVAEFRTVRETIPKVVLEFLCTICYAYT